MRVYSQCRSLPLQSNSGLLGRLRSPWDPGFTPGFGPGRLFDPELFQFRSQRVTGRIDGDDPHHDAIVPRKCEARQLGPVGAVPALPGSNLAPRSLDLEVEGVVLDRYPPRISQATVLAKLIVEIRCCTPLDDRDSPLQA
jgi:hypothetical protein